MADARGALENDNDSLCHRFMQLHHKKRKGLTLIGDEIKQNTTSSFLIKCHSELQVAPLCRIYLFLK